MTLLICFIPMGHASKLSRFIEKSNERDRVREENLQRQDMNFADFAFRLDKRYIDNRNQKCRDYVFRSRSNPYRHGFYTVCEER